MVASADGNITTNGELGIRKEAGLVIDYIGVFTRLGKALAKYAQSQESKSKYPAEMLGDLLGYLDAAIKFIADQELAIARLTDCNENFDKLAEFRAFADSLSPTEELKKEFAVYQLAIMSFYEACKPNILTESLLPDSPHRGKY